jgi:hypothetical protein
MYPDESRCGSPSIGESFESFDINMIASTPNIFVYFWCPLGRAHGI